MAKYEYVIWDFNGTLLDDVKLCYDLLNKMLSKRGFKTVSFETYKEIFMFPVKEYYRKAGFDFEKEPFEVTAIEFINDYQPMSLELEIHKETYAVLDEIKKNNVKQIILSASKIENLLEQTKHFKLDSYMDCILGTDTIHAISKVTIAKEWITNNNIDPNTVIFIGDTDHDLEVANSIGVNCLLVADGHQSKERLLKKTNNVVDKIEEVLGYIL